MVCPGAGVGAGVGAGAGAGDTLDAGGCGGARPVGGGGVELTEPPPPPPPQADSAILATLAQSAPIILIQRSDFIFLASSRAMREHREA